MAPHRVLADAGFWKGVSDMRKRLPKGRVHVTSTLFGSGGMERAVLGGERAADRVIREAEKATPAPSRIHGTPPR